MSVKRVQAKGAMVNLGTTMTSFDPVQATGSRASSLPQPCIPTRKSERRWYPNDAMRQVRYVCSDTPSQTLHDELASVCPNMEAVCLDPAHIVIVYNNAHWKKRSDGQNLLRRLQAKWNRVDLDMPSAHWDDFYKGGDPPHSDLTEDFMCGVLISEYILLSVGDSEPR